MHSHEDYMHRCLALAQRGAGSVAPNPLVGAVLVYKDQIIGEGWHQQYGHSHAEVNCIADAMRKGHEDLFTASTLYVNLEPCAHHGKTPPCTDLIIQKKIPRVVVGIRDPFPLVDGKGIEKMKNASVEVTTPLLEAECGELNRRFLVFYEEKRPYIILKWAQTKNGLIGGRGKRYLISGEAANRLVHKWRSEEAAILVGTRTALADDPFLTTRYGWGRSPVRMVIDMDLKLQPPMNIFRDDGPLIVFNSSRHDAERGFKIQGIKYYRLTDRTKIPELICNALFELQLQSVIIEGGAKTLQSFIDAGLWDECRVIVSDNEQQIEDPVIAPELKATKLERSECAGMDNILYYFNS